MPSEYAAHHGLVNRKFETEETQRAFLSSTHFEIAKCNCLFIKKMSKQKQAS